MDMMKNKEIKTKLTMILLSFDGISFQSHVTALLLVACLNNQG
jgi:hypothetical protein